MLIHLHNRAIVRHWSENNGEGDDDTEGARGDLGQHGARPWACRPDRVSRETASRSRRSRPGPATGSGRGRPPAHRLPLCRRPGRSCRFRGQAVAGVAARRCRWKGWRRCARRGTTSGGPGGCGAPVVGEVAGPRRPRRHRGLATAVGTLRRGPIPFQLPPLATAAQRADEPAPLRATKSETFDCLKFTLEGAGERSDGNARPPCFRVAFLA